MQKRILLIEDEQYVRDIYKRQLDLAGFQTDAFSTSKEGVEAASKNQYDLALIDLMLPDTNGIETLKLLKSNPASNKIPAVFLTNLGQESLIKQGYETGAVAYLIKGSHTPNQIVQEVQNILQKVSNKEAEN